MKIASLIPAGMPRFLSFASVLAASVVPSTVPAQDTAGVPPATEMLPEIRMRDACVLPDPDTQTYIMIASGRGARVRAYTSTDLVNWTGPRIIFETPEGFWPDAEIRGIWAPEMHRYRGKYYLFLTFDTRTEFPEQWRNWLPRVKRGSQVLVSDSPFGPYKAFAPRSTLPPEMMTLDGTLWVEDGVPYMVYCHEWVQIVNGTMELIQLADDLSATVGEPMRLFFGNDAPWSRRSDTYGCWVTDAPWLHRSKSGKLFMTWSSGGPDGYAVGLAVSDSGRLAGPWVQQPEPVFREDGGHAMVFERFDGQLMMALHQPNDPPQERIRLFEVEDTGETLRVLRAFPNL